MNKKNNVRNNNLSNERMHNPMYEGLYIKKTDDPKLYAHAPESCHVSTISDNTITFM